MIPMMVDQGYDADFSTAVTITSSCEGLLVPPSHNMVIYATTAGGISVGALFLAGYLPAAVLAIALMVGSYIISVKRNYPKGEKFHLINFLKQLLTSIWALLAIVVVVVGVVGGAFTAEKRGPAEEHEQEAGEEAEPVHEQQLTSRYFAGDGRAGHPPDEDDQP